MRMMPADSIPEDRLRAVRLLASDIDDTLTENGSIQPEVLDCLYRLRKGGVKVYLVTGRCAAWGQALSHYLDIDGVISENGGVLSQDESIRLLADLEPIGQGRAKLREAYEKIRKQIPRAETTEDNIGRLTDWTFNRRILNGDELALAANIAGECGLRMIYSSIHVHLFAGTHDKATALQEVCRLEGVDDPNRVATMGDSPNDEPMFDPKRFPFSMAVANIEKSIDRMINKPLFALPFPEARGALWLLRKMLVVKGL